MSLAQGHNTVTRVRIEPPTSRSEIGRPNQQASAPPVSKLKKPEWTIFIITIA